jgi:hypothetical protein
MNRPEKTVPLPEWYGSRALPALKKMWQDFLAKKAAVDARQSEYYNSVFKFEKVKKVPPPEEMSFGAFLFSFFGFRIEFKDGTPGASESALQKVAEATGIKKGEKT